MNIEIDNDNWLELQEEEQTLAFEIVQILEEKGCTIKKAAQVLDGSKFLISRSLLVFPK